MLFRSGGDRFIMVISQALVNLAATVGIVGSIVGLFLSAPLIAIFGTLVWSTSCAGKTLASRIGQIREQHVGFDGITLKIIHRIANIFRDDAKT